MTELLKQNEDETFEQVIGCSNKIDVDALIAELNNDESAATLSKILLSDGTIKYGASGENGILLKYEQGKVERVAFENELSHIACEMSQQDWNNPYYEDIYYKAFVAGGEWFYSKYEKLEKQNAELRQQVQELQENVEILKRKLQDITAEPTCCGNVHYDEFGYEVCCGERRFTWPEDVVDVLFDIYTGNSK